MAKDKKSFVLYADYVHVFRELSDEEAGRLIKHIFEYVNDSNPDPIDRLTKISFEPIKQQLKRDLRAYDEIKEKRAEWGRKGGLAKASIPKPTKVNLSGANLPLANVAENVTDTVNGTVTDTVTVNEINYKTNLDFGKDYSESDTMMTNAMKTAKSFKLPYTKDRILDYLRAFVIELESKAEKKQDFKSFSAHFISWMKINAKNIQPTEINNSYKPLDAGR